MFIYIDQSCAVKIVGVSIFNTKMLKGLKQRTATGTLRISKNQLVEIACKIIKIYLISAGYSAQTKLYISIYAQKYILFFVIALFI